MAEGTVIVISGPPGAGKTTVARGIAGGFPFGVHLPSDEFWHFIRCGRVEPWMPQAARQNGVVIDALVAAAVTYALGDYAVVLDGVVGPWFIDRFLRGTSRAGVALQYVVLRPSAEICVARATSRAPSSAKAEPLRREDVIRDLYHQFQELGEYEAHALDTSAMSVADATATVTELIEDGRFVLPADRQASPPP